MKLEILKTKQLRFYHRIIFLTFEYLVAEIFTFSVIHLKFKKIVILYTLRTIKISINNSQIPSIQNLIPRKKLLYFTFDVLHLKFCYFYSNCIAKTHFGFFRFFTFWTVRLHRNYSRCSAFVLCLQAC